jgi:hypothetical protein
LSVLCSSIFPLSLLVPWGRMSTTAVEKKQTAVCWLACSPGWRSYWWRCR